MFGGRTNPRRALGDMHLLSLRTQTWHTLDVHSLGLRPRFRHSILALDDDRVFVFGGVGVDTQSGSLQLLSDWAELRVDFETLSVSVVCQSESDSDSSELAPRASFVCEHLRRESGKGCVLVYGGLLSLDCSETCDAECVDRRVHILDLDSREWTHVEPSHSDPCIAWYGLRSSVASVGSKPDSFCVLLSGGLNALFEGERQTETVSPLCNECVWALQLRLSPSRTPTATWALPLSLGPTLFVGHSMLLLHSSLRRGVLCVRVLLVGGCVRVLFCGHTLNPLSILDFEIGLRV